MSARLVIWLGLVLSACTMKVDDDPTGTMGGQEGEAMDLDADADADSDADADDTGSSDMEYAFGEVTIDGMFYESGDAVTVTFDLINMTDDDDYAYPTARLRTDAVWVDILPPELPFYGVSAGESQTASFTLTANDEAVMGALAEVHMEVIRMHCETDAEIECPTFAATSFTVGVEYPED